MGFGERSSTRREDRTLVSGKRADTKRLIDQNRTLPGPCPMGLSIYRVAHLLASLGWVDFDVPPSAWADGKLADVAEQVGKMMEQHKSKSTQPRFSTAWAFLYNALLHSLFSRGLLKGDPKQMPAPHVKPRITLLSFPKFHAFRSSSH